MSKNTKNKSKKIWIARFVLAVVIVVALMVSTIWSEQIDRKMGLTKLTESGYKGDNSHDDVISTASIGDLKVHFVDVGQGDACILELPDEKKMIIDGGKDSEKEKILSYIDSSILDADGSKLDYFDYSVLTHSDEDHCGGLDDVLLKYPAKVFYRPNILGTNPKYDYIDPAEKTIKADKNYTSHQTKAYAKALEAGYNEARTNNITTETRITDANNDAISLIAPPLAPSDPKYYSITFYAPVVKSFEDVNNYSPIIILDYQGKRMALSGDAEVEAEESFVEQANKGEGKYAIFNDTYSVNVIKLGHHGSRTASTQKYLETLTTPDSVDDVVIIVSCALVNSYGHPHKETLDRLKSMGFSDKNILSTAKNASIALAVKPEVNASSGKTEFNLYYGGEVLRYEEPRLKAGKLKMQWKELAITISILTVLFLLILPLIHKTPRYKKR